MAIFLSLLSVALAQVHTSPMTERHSGKAAALRCPAWYRWVDTSGNFIDAPCRTTWRSGRRSVRGSMPRRGPDTALRGQSADVLPDRHIPRQLTARGGCPIITTSGSIKV